MEKTFTLIQTIATAAALCYFLLVIPFTFPHFPWKLYGFMFSRESARKELGDVIEDLRRGNPSSGSPPRHS